MRFVFLDDSRQGTPSRPGMGPLVAIGGLSIDGDRARDVERALDRRCKDAAFPPGEPFKWSPGRELWMREGLTGQARQQFYLDVLNILKAAKATAHFVASDITHRRATGATSFEADVTNMILERIHMHLETSRKDGLVITDRPSGGRPDEDKFLLGCLEMRQAGAGYVVPKRICVNVVSSPSKFIRLLQAADLIVSCSLSRVAGEFTYSPPIFDAMKKMFCAGPGRTGGIGFKLHPDFRFANLYHWLIGDKTFWRMGVGVGLPLADRPYAKHEYTP